MMGICSTVRVVLIVFLSCGITCLAKVYIVGDSTGWSLNVNYNDWTTGKTFKPGDTLVFNYGSSHSVDEVSPGDYGACSVVGNSIASYISSPATITLNTTGTHYFICGVPGHCSGGMKVSVQVTGASPAPSSGTDASPSTKPTPTPPTATSTGSIPPSSSAAISPVVAVVCILVSLVFKLVLF